MIERPLTLFPNTAENVKTKMTTEQKASHRLPPSRWAANSDSGCLERWLPACPPITSPACTSVPGAVLPWAVLQGRPQQFRRAQPSRPHLWETETGSTMIRGGCQRASWIQWLDCCLEYLTVVVRLMKSSSKRQAHKDQPGSAEGWKANSSLSVISALSGPNTAKVAMTSRGGGLESL